MISHADGCRRGEEVYVLGFALKLTSLADVRLASEAARYRA
jgi:hypothetical protein